MEIASSLLKNMEMKLSFVNKRRNKCVFSFKNSLISFNDREYLNILVERGK